MSKLTYTQRKRMAYYPIVIVALVLFTLFFTVPACYSLFYSFTDWNGFSQQFNFVGLQNFANVFTDKALFNSVRFTVLYTVVLNALVIPASLGLAVLLTQKIRFLKAFRALFFYPAILSMLTLGLIWNELLRRAIPGVGKALGVEFLQTSLLSTQTGAVVGVILVSLWQSLSIPTVLFIASLQSVPAELNEAAYIDGAGAFVRFKTVTLPFLMPTLTLCLVKGIRDALVVFDYIMAMTQGGPVGATESMGYRIYQMGVAELKFGQGCATSMVLFAMIGVFSAVVMHFMNRKGIEQQ